MLKRVEHEILNAHKYKNIKKSNIFLGSGKPRMLFFPLINVKNANNCWHFNIYEQEKISCSVELSMKKVL